MQLDIITIGSSTIDIFLDLNLKQIKKKNKVINIPLGDKIPLKNLFQEIGGNAVNTSIGFSKLGLNTGIITTLDNSALSLMVISRLKKYKIKLFINFQKSMPPNFSIILDYKTKRTVLSYHINRNYIIPEKIDTKWIYLTSLGGFFENVKTKLIKLILDKNINLAFNPGSSEIKLGLKRLKKLFLISDILILNKEETEFLSGFRTKKIKKLLYTAYSKFFKDLPKKSLIVTDGPKGAYFINQSKILKINSLGWKAKEPTGAGDSFSSGFLSGIIKNLSIEKALKWGILNSGFCIQKLGAQNGLLTEKQIIELEKKYNKRLKINSL